MIRKTRIDQYDVFFLLLVCEYGWYQALRYWHMPCKQLHGLARKLALETQVISPTEKELWD